MPDLKQLRSESGLTGTELTRITGKSPTLISQIISGQRGDTVGVRKIMTDTIARRRRIVAVLCESARRNEITQDDCDALVAEVQRMPAAHMEALEATTTVMAQSAIRAMGLDESEAVQLIAAVNCMGKEDVA